MNVTIAEVLHKAADEILAEKQNEYWIHGGNKQKYSCCAVSEAVWLIKGHNRTAKGRELNIRVMRGLSAMGCDTGSTTAFRQDPDVSTYNINSKIQHDRYFWLKWAALMAEEQGV